MTALQSFRHTQRGPRNWLEVNHTVRMSYQAAQRASRNGLKLIDLDLVMEYGERVEDGYLMSDRALSQALRVLEDANAPDLIERLSKLRNVVVVEMMDTIITTYRLPAHGPVEAQPQQGEFILH